MTDTAWLEAAGLSVASAQGLDVSLIGQGPLFDWAAAKQRIPQMAFGIYKMTEGLGFTDGAARHNHDGIKAAGLHHGAYHFLRPGDDGHAQARFFVAQHRQIGLDPADMLWLDHETADGVPPAAAAACAQAFMTELAVLCPHNPMGVYTFINFAMTGYCHGLGHWPLWLAYPAASAPAPPPPWANWKFWQWGSRDGADADAFNGTAAGLDSWLASYAAGGGAGGGGGPAPFEHVTAGELSLAALAAQHHETPAQIIRDTAAHATAAQNEQFGEYLNAMAQPFEPLMPAGLHLWLRRTP